MKKIFEENVLYFALIQALMAILGSLYFSEILKIPPCDLCWYQRIVMYPLALIIPVGIMLKDKKLPFYVLPLSLTGVLIAFYQNLLQLKIIPQSISPCKLGVSCAQIDFQIASFITIPFLSLLAFAFISLCMVFFIRLQKK